MTIGIEAQRLLRAHKHGMDVVALELIRCLQQTDVQNEYLVFTKKGPDASCLTDTSNFHTQLVNGHNYAYWEQVELRAALKKTRPDLIHCTANTAPLNCPVPLIATVHDIIYMEQPNFGGSAYQNFGNLYRRVIVPRIIRQAKAIVTVSEFEKKIIVEKNRLHPSKVHVVYNGVAERFHPVYDARERDAFCQAFRMPKDFILVLGNRSPKKNTAGMIKAYAHYCYLQRDPLPLVIVDYEKKYVEHALRKMGKPELIDKFIFAGYVPTHQMPLLYNCCTLFVYPSLRESFGLPVLEAMASGVPVITSNVSALPEIAGDAALLVDPADHEAIARAIELVLSDRALRESHINRGIARAARFRWENSARQLRQLYESVL